MLHLSFTFRNLKYTHSWITNTAYLLHISYQRLFTWARNPHFLVLGGSRNGFQSGFTFELSKIEGLMEDWLKSKTSPLVMYRHTFVYNKHVHTIWTCWACLNKWTRIVAIYIYRESILDLRVRIVNGQTHWQTNCLIEFRQKWVLVYMHAGVWLVHVFAYIVLDIDILVCEHLQI